MRATGSMFASLLWLVTALSCAGSVEAQENAAVVFPGGPVETALAGTADVYVGAPEPAAAGPACKAAKTYVDRIQAGSYDTVVDLFTSDALLIEPTRKEPRVGRARIDDFYRNAIGRAKPKIVAVGYVGEGSDCFVELAVEMQVNGRPRYVLTSVDHFTVDKDGLVTRMLAYSRPLGAGVGAPRVE